MTTSGLRTPPTRHDRNTPSPPSDQRRTPARTAVLVTIGALLLAALLNPDDMSRRAHLMKFGWERDVLVAVTDAAHDVSHALWLDRPRHALDALFGHTPAGTPAPVVTARHRPAGWQPSTADPLRVYFGGDSVAAAPTQAFKALADRLGDLAATTEFRYSSGLTRPDYFNWTRHLAEIMAAARPPDVVVVLFGANDIQPILAPAGPVHIRTAAWLAEYRRRVNRVMSLLSRSGAYTIWVGQPAMRAGDFDAATHQLDDIYRAEAARHVRVGYFDTRALFAGADGGYAAYLRGANGQPVLMRTSDGVHVTAAGGSRLAMAILARIGRRWPIGLETQH